MAAAMTRARLEAALGVAAQAVTLYGAPARGIFRRLESELERLEAAEEEARALDRRAAEIAAKLRPTG